MENNQLDLIHKYHSMLEAREKQIKNMAEMLAELNDKLNDALLKGQALTTENKELQKKVNMKENIIQQELRDKELIFSKLQTLEREKDKLAEKVSSLEGKVGHDNVNNKRKQSKEQASVIETSKGKIQTDNGDNSYLSPNKLITPETMRKQDSLGSEKGADDDEDVLNRIRKNLKIDAPQNE